MVLDVLRGDGGIVTLFLLIVRTTWSTYWSVGMGSLRRVVEVCGRCSVARAPSGACGVQLREWWDGLHKGGRIRDSTRWVDIEQVPSTCPYVAEHAVMQGVGGLCLLARLKDSADGSF